MNTQSNAITEPSIPSQGTPAAVSAARAMYWSIRRGLWENRSIYIGPLAAAIVFLFGFMINFGTMRRRIAALLLDPLQQHHFHAPRYELSAGMSIVTAITARDFYS